MNLSSRGLRDMDEGPEEIADPQELITVRRQARRVHGKAALVAVIVTAVLMLLPG